jgi:hypothetical protein
MSDSREIAEHGGGARSIAGRDYQPTGIPIEQRMAMLREALTNPDVDPAKAVAMADLMFKLEDRDRQAEFNRDKINAKRAMPPIYKRGENAHQHTKYPKFEDMQRTVDPILDAHGLSIDFRIGSEGPNITVVPILRHRNGWIEEGDAMKGPPDEGPGRSKIQAVGSSSSYLKRYAMVAMLNLILDGEDDDGMGGLRNVNQPNDRQIRLVELGQDALDGGTYAAWFGKQLPKDRAWLIASGNHERFGGVALIGADAGATARTEREPERNQGDSRADEREEATQDESRAADPPAANGESGGGQLKLGGDEPEPRQKPKLTPRQWVDGVKREIGKIGSRSKLDEYLEGKRDAMTRLRESDQALAEEVDEAYRDQVAALDG